LGWNIQEALFTQLVVDVGCQFGAQLRLDQGDYNVVIPCGLGFSQNGGWVPRVTVRRETGPIGRKREARPRRLGLELSQCHFHQIQLQGQPRFKGRGHKLYFSLVRETFYSLSCTTNTSLQPSHMRHHIPDCAHPHYPHNLGLLYSSDQGTPHKANYQGNLNQYPLSPGSSLKEEALSLEGK